MRTLTMLVFALLLCGSAWAEDCSKGYYVSTPYEICRIANALEEIARKMPEPTNLPTAPQSPEASWTKDSTE